VQGKAIRFAPARGKEPAATFWKLWVEGSDIYATTRNSGGAAKLSVHASGQIHFRHGPKEKKDVAPLMLLGRGPWMHAFELRFLLSENAGIPLDQMKSLKHRSAQLIAVPPDAVLHINLVIGSRGMPANSPLPLEFGGGQPLWRATLTDGRQAALVGRIIPLSAENQNFIKYFREELKPTITLTKLTEQLYVEILNLKWNATGNLILVVPMGAEALRSEEAAAPAVGAAANPRAFQCLSTGRTVELVAPDGSIVAELEFEPAGTELALVKNVPSTHKIGKANLRLKLDNLILGSKFMLAPVFVTSAPEINGGTPRNWGYTVSAKFDGVAFSAEIRKITSGLRNKNLSSPIANLGNDEEITINVPWEPLILIATAASPLASAEIIGRFTLREAI
jgi:hypothetical protein